MSLRDAIKKLALQEFDSIGFCRATSQPNEIYQRWIENGFHASMDYLKRHIPQKENPNLLLSNAKTWIVLTSHYDTQEPLSISQPQTNEMGWVARYCRGEDYHTVLKNKLESLARHLKEQYSDHAFWCAVDSSPVAERDIAAKAGLGWIGKNSCLIHPQKGSFFFIAEILTTLDIPEDKPILDHCGTCSRCIQACPTNAITSDRTVDSNNCISFWTIEAKTEIPSRIASQLKGNLFGCDICQDVCPWNEKARRQRPLPEASSSGRFNLQALLEKPDDVLKTHLSKTSLSRTKPAHLKRTAQLIKTRTDL